MALLTSPDFRALVSCQTVIFLHLILSSAGQCKLVNPYQPIAATVGDDTILPCHLEPAVDAVSMTLEWSRPDLKPEFVHVRRAGEDVPAVQNPSYKGRTSVSTEKLKRGDVSLKLSKVELSDNGTYRCYIPKLDKESFVSLSVDDIPPGTPVLVIVLVVIVMIIALGVGCLTKCQVDLCPCVEIIGQCAA